MFGQRLMLLHVRAGIAWVTSGIFPTIAGPLFIAVLRGYTWQRPITLGDLHWAARTRRLSNKRRGMLRGRAVKMLNFFDVRDANLKVCRSSHMDDWTLQNGYTRREDIVTEGGCHWFKTSVHGCNREITNIHSFCSARFTSELCQSRTYSSTK